MFALRRYGLAGFQWMYLRLKSFQRFTETWALLERCAAAGLFQSRGEGGIFAPTAPGEGRPLRVVSLVVARCMPPHDPRWHAWSSQLLKTRWAHVTPHSDLILFVFCR